MCHKYLLPLLVVNICNEFSKKILHLVVSAANQALPINLLYVVAHLVTKKLTEIFDQINHSATSMYGMLLMMLPSLILLMKA